MTNPSFIQQAAKVHPAIILPAVGVAAWFMAGLLPGNGTTPAQARPERGTSRAASTAATAALPDRLPESLAAIVGPAAPSASPAYVPSGGSLGPSGGPAGDSPSGGGKPPKRAAQAGQARQAGATQPDHAHRREGLAALHPRPGQPLNRPIAPTASPRPRMAYVAPVAPPPRVMAPAPSPFPFFGGGHFIPRANFGGGHFGGGGRHR